LKAYKIWNVEQIEGLPDEFYTLPDPQHTDSRIDDIENFIKTVAVPVVETGGDSAYFSKGIDFLANSNPKVSLPRFENFKDASEYYATVFHELAHWTGTAPQLDRPCYAKYHEDRKERAKEEQELVAELTASFLCAQFGIKAHAQDASYIASWVKLLEDDEKAIFKAASQAQKACDYLLQRGGISTHYDYTPKDEAAA